MAARAVVASPVLVGRDDVLATADRWLRATAGGAGRLAFLAGEAGIGKTRLLASIGRRAERDGFTVARAAAYPNDADESGGVLLDLAGDLRRAADPGVGAVGAAMSARLREPAPAEDPRRRRRLLVQDLADALSTVDGAGPVLVLLEDLHWSDRLSLEVVGQLAARLAFRRTLVVGAYRSDELYAGTPMRELRTRLLSQRLAEEVRLPRLTPAQTATLTSAVLGRPAPARVVAALQERSDGIPLHVEELLAGTDPAGEEVPPAVPDTLADAVLARAGLLDGVERDIAAAAAVIGRSFDFDLLADVSQQDPDTVDRCLRRLQQVFLVRAGTAADRAGTERPGGGSGGSGDGGGSGGSGGGGAAGDAFDFRHALIRDAIYADVPLRRRRQLHERVALVAVERGHPDAFVSLHFDRAGLAGRAYPHALAAARSAAAISAHREAYGLYRRALRDAPELPPGERAALLAALGDEAAAVDDNDAAAAAYEQAHALWTGAGDVLAAAAVVPAQVAVGHLRGEGLATRAQRLDVALSTVHGVAGAEPVRARLLSALAAAYMLDRRLDASIGYAEASRELSAPDDPVALDTAATLGSVLLFAGRLEEGWAMLEDTIDRSVRLRRESEAARGHRMLGTSDSVLVEYERAERELTRGIAYAGSVELWNHQTYMAAHLAHVQWARGDWDRAAATAEHALTDGRGSTTRITAGYVLGYLALGRGEHATATELLTEALHRGESMTELQRLSPPLWGLAENALLQGDAGTAVELCERGYAASAAVQDAAYLFPFLVTGVRALLATGGDAAAWTERVAAALLARGLPGTLPAIDHARGLVALAGRDLAGAAAQLAAAAAAWAERGRFWEGSWAGLDRARCAAAAGRGADAAAYATGVHAAAAAVGATPLTAAADAILRTAESRRRTAAPWHPLSDREYDVARLVAAGLTNREIAARLVLSPKTVSAHVERILTKLDAGRRAEIAAWAARIDPDGMLAR